MAENIFILGAGASCESGAPLMNNFLDVAEDLLREGTFGDDTEKIGKVYSVISALCGSLKNLKHPLNNTCYTTDIYFRGDQYLLSNLMRDVEG